MDSKQIFELQRHRQFGKDNPEKMNFEHWIRMFHTGLTPYEAIEQFDGQAVREGHPDWCFGPRTGTTTNKLPDGRVIHIGGEYEDWYDDEFCIYNDVIVEDRQVEIYGYPRSAFPPTDFHSSTLISDNIIIIGRLGYDYERTRGETPAYSLDTNSLKITAINCYGDNPGWIYRHSAKADNDESILLCGGRVMINVNNKWLTTVNLNNFTLNTNSFQWTRVFTLYRQAVYYLLLRCNQLSRLYDQ